LRLPSPHQQSNYLWHDAPDGGAIRFDSSGNIIDTYSILSNSNPAGVAARCRIWLSCEEYEGGVICVTDPFGISQAIKRPALATFGHEAVAVDTTSKYCYLTEDKTDGYISIRTRIHR
jgi:uncharacterized protein